MDRVRLKVHGKPLGKHALSLPATRFNTAGSLMAGTYALWSLFAAASKGGNPSGRQWGKGPSGSEVTDDEWSCHLRAVRSRLGLCIPLPQVTLEVLVGCELWGLASVRDLWRLRVLCVWEIVYECVSGCKVCLSVSGCELFMGLCVYEWISCGCICVRLLYVHVSQVSSVCIYVILELCMFFSVSSWDSVHHIFLYIRLILCIRSK